MIADPYKVLGVSPTDSDEEITKAYRKLAKKYHPDVNQGNAESAKKMSEINAAYEQIKSGNTQQSTETGGYSRQTTYDDGNSSGAYDPFGGFNPFGFDPFSAFGFYGNSQQQRQENPVFSPVRNYLQAGYYQEALNALTHIAEKSAEWYYYSAIANDGAGNKITALNHAKIAVQMDPQNLEYRRVLNQVQNGGRMYQQQSQSYGMPSTGLDKICLGICLARMLCMFCR